MRGKRDGNERSIIDALEAAGCTVEQVEKKPYDLIVGNAGQNTLMECKTKRGKLRESQIIFRQQWEGRYFVVRSPQEALAAMGLLSDKELRELYKL